MPCSKLEAKGILKGGNVAPALQAKQEELRKAQLEDTLEKGLEKRPTKEEVNLEPCLCIRGLIIDSD